MKPFPILLFSVILAACGVAPEEKKAPPPVGLSQYLFSFVDSAWLYKGQPFKMQQPIGYYVNLFGPYNRGVLLMDSMYVWDKLGIEIAIPTYVDTSEGERAHVADRLYVVFDYEYQDDIIDSANDDLQREIDFKTGTKEQNDARPKPFFQGSINLGNVELHKGMHIDTLINRLDKRPEHYMFFKQDVLRSFFRCSYDDAAIPFVYYVHVNDSMIIDEFNLNMGTTF